jgi:hypothetical protein
VKTNELPPGRAVTLITAGTGSALLKGKKQTFRYDFSQSKDGRLVFARTENMYLGYMNVVNNGASLTLNVGRRGNSGHPAFQALAWYLHQAVTNPEVAKQATFWEVIDEDE